MVPVFSLITGSVSAVPAAMLLNGSKPVFRKPVKFVMENRPDRPSAGTVAPFSMPRLANSAAPFCCAVPRFST